MSTFKLQLRNKAVNKTYFCSTLIASGGFGQVWAGYHSTHSYAVKVIKRTSNIFKDFIVWNREHSIAAKCYEHPYIVKVVDHFYSENGHLVIVMERAIRNLQSIIDSGFKYTSLDVCNFGLQIASAINHLHSLNIIHRDITPKNILLFEGGIYKLSDFSISKSRMKPNDFARTFVGNPCYIPPELLMHGVTNYRSDFYQLGLVLLSMLAGRNIIPFNGNNDFSFNYIRKGIPRQTAENLIPVYGKLAVTISTMLRRTNNWRQSNASAIIQDLHCARDEINNQYNALNFLSVGQGNQFPGLFN